MQSLPLDPSDPGERQVARHQDQLDGGEHGPLWRQQLAQAITIYRMGDAANAVKAASDLTNELLQANAET